MAEPRQLEQKQVNQFVILEFIHNGWHQFEERLDPKAQHSFIAIGFREILLRD